MPFSADRLNHHHIGETIEAAAATTAATDGHSTLKSQQQGRWECRFPERHCPAAGGVWRRVEGGKEGVCLAERLSTPTLIKYHRLSCPVGVYMTSEEIALGTKCCALSF